MYGEALYKPEMKEGNPGAPHHGRVIPSLPVRGVPQDN